MTSEQVATFYEHETTGLEHPVKLEDMYHISKTISDDDGDYRHSEVQAAIAGIIVSNDKDFIITVSPTGSGKTWI